MNHKSKREEKHRLKHLYEETSNSVCGGAYYSDKKQRYVRYWSCRTPGYTKYLRRISNRRVRHCKELMQGGQYKKLYAYWWEVI